MLSSQKVNQYSKDGLNQTSVCAKMRPQPIFQLYQDWARGHAGIELGQPARIRRNNDQSIHIATYLSRRVGPGTVIVQINDIEKARVVEPDEFYRGHEPSYHVIRRSYDVIKTEKIREVKATIQARVELIGSQVIPIFFLNGQYGNEKSTFTYRLIYNFLHDPDQQYYALQVVNVNKLDFSALSEAIVESGFKNVILFVDSAEQDNVFKIA